MVFPMCSQWCSQTSLPCICVHNFCLVMLWLKTCFCLIFNMLSVKCSPNLFPQVPMCPSPSYAFLWEHNTFEKIIASEINFPPAPPPTTTFFLFWSLFWLQKARWEGLGKQCGAGKRLTVGPTPSRRVAGLSVRPLRDPRWDRLSRSSIFGDCESCTAISDQHSRVLLWTHCLWQQQ
jgi:hypothetical protein